MSTTTRIVPESPTGTGERSLAPSHRPAVRSTALDCDVVIVGGGPAGLATAGALHARGRTTIVLERADRLVPVWTGLRPSLRLHTTRRRSGVPGAPIDRRLGQYIHTTDFVDYWKAYTARLGLDVRTGNTVARITYLGEQIGGARWAVQTADGTVLRSRSVVLATGRLGAPRIPSWPGLDRYRGTVFHAAELHDPAAFAGRSVLVVGSGNAGAEACVDLVAAGAAPVWLSIRTPPQVLSRRTGPVPAQTVADLLERLPTRIADRIAVLQRRLTVPDLRRYGLPAPSGGLYSDIRLRHVPPTNDTGIVDAIRTGRVTPVAAPAEFEAESVRLTDGTTVAPDVVIAATGYEDGTTGLPPLIGIERIDTFSGRFAGHPERGLYLIGFDVPASGILHAIVRRAEQIAADEPRGRSPEGPTAERARRRGRRAHIDQRSER
jgi:putative flavoprotein involved in K+ transport